MPKIRQVEEQDTYSSMEEAVRKVAKRNGIVIGRGANIIEYSYGSWGDLEIKWINKGIFYTAKKEAYNGY